MRETLIPLAVPPGVVRAGTVYQTKGRWYDADLVRFRAGAILPVGGWRRVTDAAGANLAALTGMPRACLGWRADDGSAWLAFATISTLSILAGGTMHDVTPVGFTAGVADGAYTSATGAYGDGAYGSGAYGVGPLTATFSDPDTWQLDMFGEELAAVSTSDEKLYLWDGNVANLAAVPAGAPTSVGAVVVTPERFLFALNTISTGGGAQNTHLVRWPSQESTTDWTPSAVNTAGEFSLATNGALMAGRRTRGGTLLWTDLDLWLASYIGGTLLYRFDQVGDQCGLIAPNAVATIDGRAAWMGTQHFHVFDGYVQPIPCDVADFVFNDLNIQQRKKIWALPMSAFGEVWWFYPSAGSLDIDRYVVYSYEERHWTVGALVRTCGTPASASVYPVMVDSAGLIYEHEVGIDRSGAVPYLESGPIELGDGDRVMRIVRIVPDEKTLGDTHLTLYSAMYPTDPETANGPYAPAQPTDLRLTARQVRLRYDEVTATDWRIGVTRLGVLPGSHR